MQEIFTNATTVGINGKRIKLHKWSMKYEK